MSDKPRIVVVGANGIEEAPYESDLSGHAHGMFKIARPVLNADQLCRMKQVKPRFEFETKLPGDSRGATNTVFVFSIDGELDGKQVSGALFAGEAMLVQARTLKQAERICTEGLRDTARFALMELEQRPVIELPANDGMTIEGGGRKAVGDDPELLKSDPLMRKILATEIGKMPWKH